MLSLTTLLVSLAAVAPSVLADSWGPAFSLGPTTSRIIQANTTLLPGDPPCDPKTLLTVWPGMSNGTGDLIQSTVEQWEDNSWCGATSSQWCVRASLFGSFGQIDGSASAIDGDQNITISYTRSANETWWTQLVTDTATGDELSTLSHASGHMTGWGTGTECDDECVGSTSPQYYYNTVIELEEADADFSSTAVAGTGVTYTDMVTADNGKTWTIEKIYLPAMV
ncbi:MAG: hypothetical protein M1834_000834 [Cirrosporium novae-zelandiae]|nr:MAG: hypothetical protein M1834_000834 [Cirrosporium novae-zelandiae]